MVCVCVCVRVCVCVCVCACVWSEVCGDLILKRKITKASVTAKLKVLVWLDGWAENDLNNIFRWTAPLTLTTFRAAWHTQLTLFILILSIFGFLREDVSMLMQNFWERRLDIYTTLFVRREKFAAIFFINQN